MQAETISNPFTIATHNGCITVVSNTTGQYRTIRIHTEHWTERDQDGNIRTDDNGDVITKPVRTVQLLVGPNNESDYTNFGLVGERGQVVLFRKNRDSNFYQWMKSFLENPERFPHIQFEFEGRCRRCNRLLTTVESSTLGLGPTCRELE